MMKELLFGFLASFSGLFILVGGSIVLYGSILKTGFDLAGFVFVGMMLLIVGIIGFGVGKNIW